MKTMHLAKKLLLLLFTITVSVVQGNAQCSADAGPDTVVCIGAGVQIGALPTAGSGSPVITYSWSPATGLSCTNCEHPVASPLTNQTYTLTVTDGSGCTATDDVTVTALNVPTAGFTFAPNNGCANVPVMFTNTSTGSGLTYQWNFGDPASGGANTSTLQNPTHLFNAVGTGSQNFTVTLIVTNANGCSASINQTVTILRTPGPGLLDPLSDMKNCDGTNFAMTVFNTTASGSNSNYTIQWGDGTPDFSSGTFPGGGLNHTYTTADIFDLLFIVTGTNGCVDTAIYNIANITNPAIGAANPGGTTGCGPITLCFPLNNFASNHPTTYYVVNFGDGSPLDTLPHPPPATVCHTYTTSSCGQAGNAFVFRMKAINRCDSSEASISPIRVYSGPQANFTVSQPNVCVGSPVTMLNTSIAGFNSACNSSTIFNWDFGDGQTLTTVTLTSPLHTYTAPGTYTVSLTTTNGCGSTTITRTVCVEIPPVPNFTITPNTGCMPLVTQTTNLSTLTNTCNVTRTWSVIFNGSTCLPSTGQFQFTNSTNAGSLNPQITFLQPGTYTVRLTLVNSCGTFFYDQPVTVQAPPQLTLNPLPAICAGTAVNPTAVVNNCYEAIDTYVWSFPGGSPTSASTLVPGSVTYPTNGSFTVSLTATNLCGSQTASTPLIVNPIPPALNPAVNTPLCAGQTANFTSDFVPGITYSWTGPGAFSSSLQNFSIPNVTAANAGTYQVNGSIGGCPGPVTTVNLVVNPLPVVTVTPPSATICNGSSVVLTSNGATTYNWNAAPTLNTTVGSTVTASPTATTTYTVTGTTAGCSGTANVTVTVNPLPVVNAGTDQTVCDQPIPVQLNGLPAGGTWSGPNVTPSGLFTPNGTGINSLTYSFTDGNGCTNTDVVDITVIAPILANAGPDFEACVNAAPIILNGTPAGGTWSGPSVTPGGTFTPGTVGTVTLVYTFGTATCLNTDTLIATVNPLPVADAGANFTLCIDAPIVTLSGTPAGGTWSGTGITNASGEFTPATAGAGNHILTYNYTDPVTGCSATDVLTATVNPLPIVNAGMDTTLCDQPVPVQFTATPAGGSWSGPNATAAGIFTPNGGGTFVLTYTFTDANGCTNSDTRTVTVAAPTPANAGTDLELCIDAPNTVIAGTPASGTWTGPGVTSGGIFDPTVDGIVTLVYTFGAGSCLTTDTMFVTVNPLPVANAGSDFSRCVDAASFDLNGLPAGGTWSGTGITNTALGTFDPATAGAGIHTITYSYTDPVTGCIGTDQLIATVFALPVVNAGIDTALCDQPFPIQLNGTPAGGTWTGANITAGGQFTPAGVGSTIVTYTYTNANGCTNSDTRTINVVAPVPSNAGPDLEACIDAANVVLNGTPAGGLWTGPGVTSGGVFDPTIAGTFELILSNGAGNCLVRDTMLFTVNPLPIVNAGLDFSNCVNDPGFNLGGTPIGGTWTGTGITNAALGTFDPTTAGAGIHTLTYSYTDPVTGCVASDQLTATILALPVVNAGIDTTVCDQPFPIQLTGSPAGGTWSGANITAGGVFTPAGIGSTVVTYTFTNVNGCTNSDTRTVNVIAPTPSNAGPDLDACIDAANVVLNGSPVSGTWTGPGVTSGGIFDPTVAGTFELIIANGAGNCLVRDTMLFTVNPLPVVNAGLDFSNCVNDPGFNLGGTPVGGTWTGSGITNAALGTFDPATAGAGIHTLTYTYTDPVTGCVNSDQLIATIFALPVVNAGNDTTLCDQPFPIQVNGLPAGGTWSGANITAGGIFTPAGVGSTIVTYTFTNANGCVNSDARTITVVAPVASNAGPDLEACIDAANVVLNGTPASGTWTGPGVTSGGIFDPTVAGTFELIISNGAGNCLIRDTMFFTVNPLPVVNAGPDLDFCPSDAAVNIGSNPTGGTWSGTGITNTVTGIFDPVTAGVGSHTITYTFTDPVTGCMNSDNMLAIVHPNPAVSFTFNPITCLGTSELFTNTSTLGVSYDWDFGDGGISVIQNPSHTYGAIGFFDIELIVTSAFGCMDSLTQQIEVREPPVADFAFAPDSACGPVTVNFVNNSTGPSVTYSWDFGNGQVSNLATPPAITFAAGIIADSTYTIVLSATNFCGTDTHSDQVIAMPSPQAIFGTATNIGCSPLILDITNNSIGLPDSYSWDFGDGTTGTNGIGQFQHTFTTGANDTTYTIMLAVANECGVDTVYHSITVLPNQVTAFFNVDAPSGCVPHTVNFTQFSSGATFSNWDFGDGNVSGIYSPSHTFTQAGTYTVSLFANDGCGFDTTTAIITVFPSPTVAFSSEPDSVCIDQLFTFTNLSSGLASVTWDFGDGNTSLLYDPTHTYTASGTYQVTLTGISQTNGCAASVTHPVVVSTNPVAAFTPNPVAGCMPLEVNFANNSTNTSFQSWDFGDGNTSGQVNPTHTFTTAGNYTVKLYVENANGCADSTEQVITVYPLPVAAFTIANSNSCYPPVTATFTNTSSGAIDYAWDLGNGNTSTLTSPTSTYATPGTYTIQLIATNIYGCADTTSQDFNVYQVPTANFTLPEDTVCVGEPVVFNSTSSFADSVVWNFGDGNTYNGTSVNYSFENSGIYPITIIAYGDGGCTDTVTMNTPIVVHPTPTAGFDFVNIQNPDPLSGTVEFTNTSTGATSWYWDFGNGDTSTFENPIERYNSFGDFDVTLIAINQFGCADTTNQTVGVDFFYGLFIPNALSPGSGDFEVSNFIPKGVGLKSFELLIYDDWGNLIWQTTALDADGRPTEYWDGTFNGEPVQQDAYVWKATATFLNERVWEGKEYPNGKKKRSGTVTVIR
jgi:large repetitive protein